MPFGVVEEVSTVRVEVKVGVPDGKENVLVAPAGRPDKASETVLGLPPVKVTDTLYSAPSPWVTVLEEGEIERVKSKASLTVRVRDCDRVTPPPDAVTVGVWVPAGAVARVLMVNVDVKLVDPDEGLKE